MAYLVLKDGTVYEGEGFGDWSGGTSLGEVVFNTSMSGYQEMITDLSYAGQILTLTTPQVGNYGWHDEEGEADKILLKGLVVRELSEGEGSLHADESLESFCLHMKIRGLKGVDTRALTRKIRKAGTVPGVLVREASAGLNYWRNQKETEQQEQQEQKEQSFSQGHWVYEATIREPYEIPGEGPLVAILDLGAKRNILRKLKEGGFRIKVFPAWTGAQELIQARPAGVVLSNGPGDPSGLPEIAANVKELIPRFPMLGICLGHQILALAAGGKSFKLPFGHRGGNHPVQDSRTGKTTMTAQNHGYAIHEDSLVDSGFDVVLRNLNDGTVEGMEHKDYPVISVQYHPEGSPGPEENEEIFAQFVSKIKGNQMK